VKSKRNKGMLGQANNQAPIAGPAQEQKCVHTMFERTFTKRKINLGLCS